MQKLLPINFNPGLAWPASCGRAWALKFWLKLGPETSLCVLRPGPLTSSTSLIWCRLSCQQFNTSFNYFSGYFLKDYITHKYFKKKLEHSSLLFLREPSSSFAYVQIYLKSKFLNTLIFHICKESHDNRPIYDVTQVIYAYPL